MEPRNHIDGKAVRITVTLPQSAVDWIKRKAREQNRSVSAQVAHTIETVRRLEDGH